MHIHLSDACVGYVNIEYDEGPMEWEESDLQHALCVMVSSNGVMSCPGGKSCHIPAVHIPFEAELLTAVHVAV
jgi:hypothetical protein